MHQKIENQLLKIPKQFLLDLRENIYKAAIMAANKSKDSLDKGFHASELGNQRSWLTSYELYTTSMLHEFPCTKSSGNRTAVADVNGINIVRVNINTSSGNRKVIKNKKSIELAHCNKAVESSVQPDLFDGPKTVNSLFLCVVTTFNKESTDPLLIELFVPSSDSKDFLYRVSLSSFLSKYEATHEEDVDSFDKAHPKLKKVIKKLEK